MVYGIRPPARPAHAAPSRGGSRGKTSAEDGRCAGRPLRSLQVRWCESGRDVDVRLAHAQRAAAHHQTGEEQARLVGWVLGMGLRRLIVEMVVIDRTIGQAMREVAGGFCMRRRMLLPCDRHSDLLRCKTRPDEDECKKDGDGPREHWRRLYGRGIGAMSENPGAADPALSSAVRLDPRWRATPGRNWTSEATGWRSDG